MTCTAITEMLDGTCLLARGVGVAKKAAIGWSVHSHVGRIWPSQFRRGQMVAIRFVKNKAEARKVLCEMSKAEG